MCGAKTLERRNDLNLLMIYRLLYQNKLLKTQQPRKTAGN